MSVYSVAAGADNFARTLRALGVGVVVVAMFDSVQAADLAIVVEDTAGNRLQDAVILAESVAPRSDSVNAGETNPPAATIAQNNKQFEPYVSVIRVGTAELVGGRFACERMGEIVVRGKQTSVTVFRLILPGDRAPAD